MRRILLLLLAAACTLTLAACDPKGAGKAGGGHYDQ